MARTTIPTMAALEGARSVTFFATRVEQPIGEFYSAVIPASKLVELCYFDIRGLTQRTDFTEFMGIQRELDQKRVAEIQRYVRSYDPSFPTAIVIAVEERCASFEPVEFASHRNAEHARLVRMTLRNYPDHDDAVDPILYRDVARIIDGQHRIAGLIGYDGPSFDLNVSIFVGADIATQASIFSTVNLAQTKVNKSLVFDLFDYAETRSPEKTCHEIAVVLDREIESPFFQLIKRLGVATEGRFGETLSQAAFVKGLMQYITKDALADRDAAKRKKPFPQVTDQARRQLIFRDFFTKNDDDVIVDIMWNYFDAVRHRWPTAWGKSGRGWVLNKTAGYAGLMRYLKPCYEALQKVRKYPTADDFRGVFERVQLADSAFEARHIRPGSSGEKYVYDLLVQNGPVEL